MIDTHAHLDFPEFNQDREEVIARFFEQDKGRAIVNIGVDLERSRKSIEIARSHKNIFASVGLHPDFFTREDLGEWEKILAELKELAKKEKVVAVGECGLDYFRVGDNREIRGNQRKGFLEQIKIARELNLPVIVHCRNAWEDIYEIISNFKFQTLSAERRVSNFVLHCYSGEKKDTEKFLGLPNVYFSFSGNITFPKPRERAKHLAEAVKTIPLDKIMLDSDAPFLAPQEMRGKRNEPIFVKYIANKIAEIKNIGIDEVEKATDQNATNFFVLK